MTNKKKVALVDDDQIYILLTTRVIEQTNLINLIKVFGNGRDAIDFLKKNLHTPELLPEVILLDLSMPIMDGWQFLDEYLPLEPKLGRKIIIYIVSSSISPDDLDKAKSISAVSDYIIKPITKDKLIEIIKKI